MIIAGRSMMPRRLALVALCLVLFAGGALAGDPTDQIRADIDELYRVVRGATPASAPTVDREADAILDRMFDWSRMAESSLRGHWKQRSPAERAEFTKLFAGLFRRAYVSKINVIDATKFQYLNESVEGDRASVRTRVFSKKGTAINVDYVTRLGGGRWLIEDVRVEGISLVDNYRTQFDSIIGRSSYAALLDRLRGAGK